MRVLFITATRLGDAVLSTGLLRHLLATWPQARFTVCCGPIAAGVFMRMPRLERLILVPKRRFDLHWLLLWRACAGTHWDLAIDLRGSALTFLLWARQRAIMSGGRKPGHRLVYLANTLGLPVPPLPVAWIAPEDHAMAATLLPGSGPLIGLCPTSAIANKVWPPERFAALFHALQSTLPDARAVVFGGPGAAEAAAARPVLDAIPGAIDLVGRLTVPEAAACLVRCALVVGNDSGLTHLSASTGAATLALFGPTSAAEYAPAGAITSVALADGPVGRAPMSNLSVSAALQAAEALLARANVSA